MCVRSLSVLACLLVIFPVTPEVGAGPPAKPETKTGSEGAGKAETLPKGKKWKLIWSDEFDGSKLDESKWERRVMKKHRLGYLAHDAVYLDGKGHLIMEVYEKGGKYYWGIIQTKGKFEHKYGYWVARCKLPREEGHWPAFWINSKLESFPTTQWRNDMISDMKMPSRRDFLKMSSAVAGATALTGNLGLARSAHAAGDDQIKVALIGCGGRGTGAMVNCLNVPDNLKLVAVADAFEDNARRALGRLKKHHGDKVDVPEDHIFSGFDAYCKAIDCGVDLVILATSPGFRPIHYAAAVKAGKHVFMEKPCCVDAPGFRSLMETNKLADQKGLKVGVGLQRRHNPKRIETVKRIHDAAIGDLMFLRAYSNRTGVWIRQRRPEQTEMEYQMRNWYYFVWLSGDLIVEQNIHMIDIVNWVKGEHPVEANGMGGRQVRKGDDVGQIYDHHFVEFTYADGTKMFNQCRHIPGCWNSILEVAHGTKGISDCAGKITGENKWRFRGKSTNSLDQEHVDLVAAIRNNARCNEGWYGATSSFTAVLGRMATYSGQVVKWDDAVAEGPSEMPETYAWNADPPVMPDGGGSYEHAVAVPGVYKPY